VHVQRPAADDLGRAAASTSARERERVLEARARQEARLAGTPARANAQMDARLLREVVTLERQAERPLHDAYEQGHLSARGRDRTLRVARTIADLAGSERVGRAHVVAALGYRQDAQAEQAA
jgi:magnesium chelatase family protein